MASAGNYAVNFALPFLCLPPYYVEYRLTELTLFQLEESALTAVKFFLALGIASIVVQVMACEMKSHNKIPLVMEAGACLV